MLCFSIVNSDRNKELQLIYAILLLVKRIVTDRADDTNKKNNELIAANQLQRSIHIIKSALVM